MMPGTRVPSVEGFTASIKNLLGRAREVKPDGGIDPPLSAHSFGKDALGIGNHTHKAINQNYAVIETACRDIFNSLVLSTSIEDPAFGEVWNLFDLLSILSDLEMCEPSLLFWLIEELLDTQTINGCRTVFDYLESRRERITAKHFKQKSLIILRACNELLRRLSRAEDTVFCGRVFIFMFQSFPLGDRSSVNLRGEYHVENVTVFENIPPKNDVDNDGSMEVDQQEKPYEGISKFENADGSAPLPLTVAPPNDNPTEIASSVKNVKFDMKGDKKEKQHQDAAPNMDTLYPIFWSLQENFSTPTRLFDDAHLQSFQNGLEMTMQKFKEVHQESLSRGPAKLPEESRRGVKRKRSGDDELSASFNPKYLTSRDLFDLEISDLAFRRHVLVQALVLVDFILSLTAKAKRKLEHTSNKSVLYNYVLSEDNAKWATNMRNEIAIYLQQGPEGKFYYRMVDTVLSRDKNWVHWKAEGCPPIQREPVSAEDFAEAEKAASKACANKRLRATPLGTLDLKFLSDNGDIDGMEKLKDPDRFTIPTAESFQRPIADDEFELEMAKTSEEKQLATDARASKLWRSLRIASKSRLNHFDNIDDGNNLKALFDPEGDENRSKPELNGGEGGEDQAVNIASPRGSVERLTDESALKAI